MNVQEGPSKVKRLPGEVPLPFPEMQRPLLPGEESYLILNGIETPAQKLSRNGLDEVSANETKSVPIWTPAQELSRLN